METVGTIYPYEMTFDQYKALWAKVDVLQFMGHVPIRIEISVNLGNMYVKVDTVPRDETAEELGELETRFAITHFANVRTWEDAPIFTVD